MAKAKLTKDHGVIDTSNDNIIIVACHETITGGRTLDVTGYDKSVIYAGHPVILDDDGEYKPLAITDTGLDETKADKAVGVVIATVSTELPMVGIMPRGTVNEEAFKNSTGYTYPDATKAKLNLIRFTKD